MRQDIQDHATFNCDVGFSFRFSSPDPCYSVSQPHTRRILPRQDFLFQTGLAAASSTPLLVSGQGLTTARDDMLQDGDLLQSRRSVVCRRH